MPLAAPYQDENIYSAWQRNNSALWCNRMSATITNEVCKYQKQQSCFDCRCEGCGGLHNQKQPENIPHTPLVLVWNAESICKKSEDIQEDEPENEDDELDLDDDELGKFQILDDYIDEVLAELFTGNDENQNTPEKTKDQLFDDARHDVKRRFHPGSCSRCNGFMDNIREANDDCVYRCLCCGWRTSKQYELNRKFMSNGGIA